MARMLLPVGVLLATIMAVIAVDRPPRRADLVLISRSDVFTLDPQRMSWLHDMRIGYCIFEGLVRWNLDDYALEPAAASLPEVSADGRTWTFHLRQDGRWSNGAPVTAHDFAYAWRRLLTPDTAADYSHFFFAVRGAEAFWDWRNNLLKHQIVVAPGVIEAHFQDMVAINALNQFTLQVQLTEPVPFFLDQLALAVCSPVYRPAVEGWVLDEEAASRALADGWHTIDAPPLSDCRWLSMNADTGRLHQRQAWAKPPTLVGNGPYEVESWRYKRDLRLRSNPHYHSPRDSAPATISVLTIPDANTAVLAFETGAGDWLTEVGTTYQADMLAQQARGERDDIHAFPTFGTDFFSFNCRSHLGDGTDNPFHDAAVRRAFALAVDRQVIVEQATRMNEPTMSHFVPAGSIAGYGQAQGLGHDPRAARRELATAGWEDRDEDGIIEDAAGRPFPVIDLLYTTNTDRYRWMSLELRDQWQRTLGVQVELRGTDSKFFGDDLQKGNFTIARGRWYGDFGDPTTFLDLFRSTNGNNDRGYSNPAIDATLDAAALELDPAARMTMLRDLETILFTREIPLVPICQLVQVYMFAPDRLDGLSEHPRMVQYLWEFEVSDP